MNSKTNPWVIVGLVVVAIIAIIGIFTPGWSPASGASGTRFPNGISADSTSPSAGQVRGTTATFTGAGTFSGALVTASTFTQAGGAYATSSAGNRTMESEGWDTEMTFSDTPTVGDMTLTTMASTSEPFASWSVGYARYLCVENATTTSGIDLTVAGGTGVNTNVASSSTLVLGATARLCGIAQKAADTDIEWDVTKYGE